MSEEKPTPGPEQEHPESGKSGDEAQSTEGPSASEQAKAAADNYFSYMRNVLLQPDEFFADQERGQKLNGLITFAAFLILIFLQTMIARTVRFTTRGFEFGYLANGLTTALAIGVPIVAAVFLFKWYAGRDRDGTTSLDFYIEKFGAALLLPCLLLVLAILFSLLQTNIYGWFRGAALVFTYIPVFMLSYWYVAPRRISVAAVFTLGFYLAYRLLGLLL